MRARSTWAEAVFHVLAHVRATAHLAPSAYDPSYVAEAARALGPAEERLLAADAARIGALATTFDAMVDVEQLAWLFDSPGRARACVERDLAVLEASDVDHPRSLPAVRRAGAVAEILRAAAEIEAPLCAKLPPLALDERALDQALAEATVMAPLLASSTVGVVRALGIRGRVVASDEGDTAPRIWVGAASTEHMAFQAAHEATVWEVGCDAAKAGIPWVHEDVEREAIRRLRARAEAQGKGEAHQRWLSCFAVP